MERFADRGKRGERIFPSLTRAVVRATRRGHPCQLSALTLSETARRIVMNTAMSHQPRKGHAQHSAYGHLSIRRGLRCIPRRGKLRFRFALPRRDQPRPARRPQPALSAHNRSVGRPLSAPRTAARVLVFCEIRDLSVASFEGHARFDRVCSFASRTCSACFRPSLIYRAAE